MWKCALGFTYILAFLLGYLTPGDQSSKWKMPRNLARSPVATNAVDEVKQSSPLENNGKLRKSSPTIHVKRKYFTVNLFEDTGEIDTGLKSALQLTLQEIESLENLLREEVKSAREMQADVAEYFRDENELVGIYVPAIYEPVLLERFAKKWLDILGEDRFRVVENAILEEDSLSQLLGNPFQDSLYTWSYPGESRVRIHRWKVDRNSSIDLQLVR